MAAREVVRQIFAARAVPRYRGRGRRSERIRHQVHSKRRSATAFQHVGHDFPLRRDRQLHFAPYDARARRHYFDRDAGRRRARQTARESGLLKGRRHRHDQYREVGQPHEPHDIRISLHLKKGPDAAPEPAAGPFLPS